jgi:hypothetical protein
VLTGHAGVLIADGGCVLETLMEHVGKEDHIMPYDLGAKGRSVLSRVRTRVDPEHRAAARSAGTSPRTPAACDY